MNTLPTKVEYSGDQFEQLKQEFEELKDERVAAEKELSRMNSIFQLMENCRNLSFDIQNSNPTQIEVVSNMGMEVTIYMK